MGLIASAKGTLVKTVLDKLTHGDTGSTILGAIAGAVLLSGVNFADLFSSDQNKQMGAVGTIVAAVIVGAWGWKTGKKTPPAAPPAQ